MNKIIFIYLTSFPCQYQQRWLCGHMGAGFTSYAYRLASPTCQLMKQPMAQHSGTQMECQHRMRDNA